MAKSYTTSPQSGMEGGGKYVLMDFIMKHSRLISAYRDRIQGLKARKDDFV
jgi:hypothetical protein